ncbi:hypothetical protein NVP1101O_030 [Vibrio phage 1.101.O._10N.261.45.C6]|nr:hypothetical protein NVP1101O_030 [Vibrio phage 1.101.O._10N.261.45.C6]
MGIVFLVYILPNIIRGETLAVKGEWYDVKLHSRERDFVTSWLKHTEKSPRVWFHTQKIWRR